MHRKYKIAIIGLGSIGKRHLINIDKVLQSRNVQYSIDLIRRKSSDILERSLEKLISVVYTNYEDVPNDYDVVFITNPTYLHFDTLKQFINKSKHMFIEKPVFDQVVENITNLCFKENGIYYVACPLRYTEVIQYIKNNIELDKVYSARAISSSYLPDWRSGLDYRATYSASIQEGGGVSLDLIHEWDYLLYLFGKPKNVTNFRGKFSHLEIESDDLSVYIGEYENLLVEVHLDYFGTKTIRELQLFTVDDTIIVDIVNSEIRYLKANKIIEFNEGRDSYQIKEIENFFDILEHKKQNENDIQTALVTLKIAKEGIV